MDKKKLNSLLLNKKVVSNLNSTQVKGGAHYSVISCASCETNVEVTCPCQSLDRCWDE